MGASSICDFGGFGDPIREHAHACIGSKATAHMYGLISPFSHMPMKKGETPKRAGHLSEPLLESKNVNC